ncbi:MAG: SUMF1/EgtB/PvdO family nonheme iron enzyme [Planctomycetota bacterium]
MPLPLLLLAPVPPTPLPTDLEVTAVATAPAEAPAGEVASVTCRVAWSNAWRDDRNHDAAWLFARWGSGTWTQRLLLAPDGHVATQVEGSNAAPAEIVVSEDGMGCFVRLAGPYAGDVAFDVTLRLADGALPEGVVPERWLVHGVEMVYVPEGAFEVGEPDAGSKLVSEGCALFRSGPDGAHAGTFRIESEGPIAVAPEDGALWYRTDASYPQYTGDAKGPIPAAFPKGFGAFYCMKYELDQGTYAAFLNDILEQPQAFRSPLGKPGYHQRRGSIVTTGRRFVATSPRRPHNQCSWEDGLAFSDWAGLRPLTELEFTKAARGPLPAVSGEHAWGSADKSRFERIVGASDDLRRAGADDERLAALDDRPVLGASHWRILDLSGSVWEKVVSVGHPAGRAFEGSHGDGFVGDATGEAGNADWPRGDDYARPGTGGYGYRGGGFYSQSSRPLDDRAPDVELCYRYYAAWGEGPRLVAYGYRACRTAPR